MELGSLLKPIYLVLGLFFEPIFLRRASLTLFLLAPVTAGAGVLVVNQRLTFFADAVGHTVFTGVALALILGWPEKPVVLLTGALVGLGVVYLSRHSHLASDTVIGLVFSGTIALSLALVSRHSGAARGLARFFLGDVLTVTESELAALAFLVALSLIFLFFFFNQLTLESLSPILARSRHPIKSYFAPYLFGVWLALVVTVAVWLVGVLLVTALLVAPAAAGRCRATSAGTMFWGAQAVALVSGQAGLYLSTRPQINMATGTTVVLAAVALFVLAYLFRRH